MQSFTDLKSWQLGIELMKMLYKHTENFPSSEKYEMVKQLRRASTSVLTNTAEGFSRHTSADKTHKYIIARGECSEVAAFLYMSIALNYGKENDAERALSLCKETGKLLTGLIQSVSQRKIPTP